VIELCQQPHFVQCSLLLSPGDSDDRDALHDDIAAELYCVCEPHLTKTSRAEQLADAQVGQPQRRHGSCRDRCRSDALPSWDVRRFGRIVGRQRVLYDAPRWWPFQIGRSSLFFYVTN
jgi:hypothetical protein